MTTVYLDRLLPVLAALVLCSGCANLSKVYLHDPERAAIAREARDTFESATSDALWPTMLENLERSNEIEQDVLNQTYAMRLEGELEGLPLLSWSALADCANGECDATGSCDPEDDIFDDLDFGDEQTTVDKLAQVTRTIEEIAGRIADLRDEIADDPNGSKVTGTLSAPPQSTLSAGIDDVEEKVLLMDEKVDALKEEKIGQLDNAIDSIVQPIVDELSEVEDRIREIVTEKIGEIQAKLRDVRAFRDLPQSAANEILDNILEGLPPEVANRLSDEAATGLQEKVYELFDPVTVYLDFADRTLEEVESDIIGALAGRSEPAKHLESVADVLRKFEHLDILKSASLRDLLGAERFDAIDDATDISGYLERLKDESLPSDFSGAMAELGVDGVQTYGALLSYLRTDESRLQEVRVALLADWRTAIVEDRARRLETLREELGYARNLAAALEQQRMAEMNLGARFDRFRSDYPNVQLDACVFDTLHCAARDAGSSNAVACTAASGKSRQLFEDGAGILAAYFSRVGYLQDNENNARVALARMAHRRSIIESQGAARAHEQLIRHGLVGLEVFTAGGVTTEETAAVLRFLNSALLAKIATDD